MTDLTPVQERGLAEQALENLVHQFARPLDFLRELVQNAIDAGTTRVEVWTRFAPPSDGEDLGVLEIHVDDFGEGMDEAIIDTQLTRMFSSTKEDDLTKIGKFGIGFTSVFAIEPDALLLRTGRHGESWELLFHADRSFDKVAVDSALVGTQVTLFKRMAAKAVPAFVEECRFVLSYWCVHSNTPVLFGERGERGEEQPEPSATDPDDPFAAFEAPADGGDLQAVTRTLDLDASPQVSLRRDGVEVIVGHADHPRYGFYNGGLTLLSTDNPDALGGHVQQLSHLAFKVKYDHLEHTLTRDNVLMDQHWSKAVDVLMEAADNLRDALVGHTKRAVRQGEDLSRWHDLLARECMATELHKMAYFQDQPLLADSRGRPTSLADVARLEERYDAVLLTPDNDKLRRALEEWGVRMIPDEPATLRFLLAGFPPNERWWTRKDRHFRRADEIFVLPDRVPDDQITADERDLLERTAQYVEEAVGRAIPLALGDLAGHYSFGELPLAVDAPSTGSACRRDVRASLRSRHARRYGLVVHRQHPLFQASLAGAGKDPHLGAYGLALALLHTGGARHPRSFQAIRNECMDGPAEPGGAP